MRRLFTFSFILLCLTAGCAPQSSILPRDPRVIVASEVSSLWYDLPNVTQDRSGLLRVTFLLHNPTNQDLPLVARIEWFDSSGQPVPTIIRGGRTMSVPRKGVLTLDEPSLSRRAVDFRIYLDTLSTGY